MGGFDEYAEVLLRGTGLDPTDLRRVVSGGDGDAAPVVVAALRDGWLAADDAVVVGS